MVNNETVPLGSTTTRTPHYDSDIDKGMNFSGGEGDNKTAPEGKTTEQEEKTTRSSHIDGSDGYNGNKCNTVDNETDHVSFFDYDDVAMMRAASRKYYQIVTALIISSAADEKLWEDENETDESDDEEDEVHDWDG